MLVPPVFPPVSLQMDMDAFCIFDVCCVQIPSLALSMRRRARKQLSPAIAAG